MSEANGAFDEAARLYAENETVIEAMYQAFGRAIDSFLNSVREQTTARVSAGDSRHLHEQIVGPGARYEYRYWWIGRKGDDKEEHPYIWFPTRRAEFVSPGRVRVTANARSRLSGIRDKLASVARTITLPPHCSPPGKGDDRGLFTIEINYGAGPDAASRLSEPISDLLSALAEAEGQPKGVA